MIESLTATLTCKPNSRFQHFITIFLFDCLLVFLFLFLLLLRFHLFFALGSLAGDSQESRGLPWWVSCFPVSLLNLQCERAKNVTVFLIPATRCCFSSNISSNISWNHKVKTSWSSWSNKQHNHKTLTLSWWLPSFTKSIWKRTNPMLKSSNQTCSI